MNIDLFDREKLEEILIKGGEYTHRLPCHRVKVISRESKIILGCKDMQNTKEVWLSLPYPISKYEIVEELIMVCMRKVITTLDTKEYKPVCYYDMTRRGRDA